MSRVSGCLWLGVALILALVAGGAAFVTVQRGTAGPSGAQLQVATAKVVVALHPVPVGTLLSDADLSVQNLPAGALPIGALGAVADARGQITTVPLNTGEMVLSHHLTKPDITAANAAFTLPSGKIAVTLKATDLMSDAAMVRSGDHVDILYSLKIGTDDLGAAGAASAAGTASGSNAQMSRQYTFGSLQNIEIVSVIGGGAKDTTPPPADQSSSNTAPAPSMTAPREYILALEPQDALVLKYLKDASATMDLGLRNVTDDSDHTAKPVDMKYIVDKFQLPVR